MDKGFISIRNEDGTQWLARDGESWANTPSLRVAHDREVFARHLGRVEASKQRDCPDNGFFGLWNLTWTDATPEQVAQADASAREAEAAMEAEDEAYERAYPGLFESPDEDEDPEHDAFALKPLGLYDPDPEQEARQRERSEKRPILTFRGQRR